MAEPLLTTVVEDEGEVEDGVEDDDEDVEPPEAGVSDGLFSGAGVAGVDPLVFSVFTSSAIYLL